MKPSMEAWIKTKWPLIDASMSRRDCLAWWESKGLPQPPRSACVFCPFHNDYEWSRLKNDDPKSFARAVALERAMQEAHARDNVARSAPFLHASRIPLDQVEFKPDAPDGKLNHFGNECEGMCGV